MESDDEVSGTKNSLTAEFWQYDPRIGRRWNVDPKSNPSISDYATFANSPIRFNDTKGDTVKYAGKDEKELYNNYRKEINSRIKSIDGELSKLSSSLSSANARKQGRINKKIEGLNKSKSLYSSINSELDALETSPEVFRIRLGKNVSNTAGGGNLTFNSNSMEMDVNILDLRGSWDNTQVLSHELKHAHQFITGQIDWIGTNGGLTYDMHDEVDAFVRQNLFAPSSEYYTHDPISFVQQHYPHLQAKNLILSNITSDEMNQMIKTNSVWMKRNSFPRFIYFGWQTDVSDYDSK